MQYTAGREAVSMPRSRAPGVAHEKRHLSLLVVDDEPGIRNFLQRALAREYGLVEAAETAEDAEQIRSRCHFDLLIVDVALPGRSGLEWIQALRRNGDGTDVIFISAYADLDSTINALRVGAADFILKPFRLEQMTASIERCLQCRELRRENAALRRRVENYADPAYGEAGMVGSGAGMQELGLLIRRVAPTGASVLVQGETGTGKELAASAIHRLSGRKGPFVPVNCVAISPDLFESELFGHTKGAFTGAHQSREGLFVAASGGTLFLDEISEMPLAMQAKLLRALENRRVRPVGSDREIPVDVRLVAATNRDLAESVRSGRFRDDLYYRLDVVHVTLPALRERAGDIPELVEFFSRRIAVDLGVKPYVFDAEELRRLQVYPWPGNVRELRNLVERTLLLGRPPWESIGGRSPIAATVPGAAGFPVEWSLDQVERRHTLNVLEAAGGNKSETARRLGISRKTLERKLSSWPTGD
ncbi:sigma-54-dependent transcriptional regulator [Sulfurifustis variabilis]|nr:sigma-54 dependent transcriptional regulator [Sulfurifustis variabilis]